MVLNFGPAFEGLLCAGFCPETDSQIRCPHPGQTVASSENESARLFISSTMASRSFLGARGSASRLSGRGFRIAISGNSPLAAGSFDRDIANIAAN